MVDGKLNGAGSEAVNASVTAQNYNTCRSRFCAECIAGSVQHSTFKLEARLQLHVPLPKENGKKATRVEVMRPEKVC